MSSSLIYLSITFIIKFFYDILANEDIRRQFKRLELDEKYRIDDLKTTKYGYQLTIECIKNGYYEELENMIPIFNKLYECKTYVKNIENNHNVSIDIVKKVSDITYIKTKLSPYELLIGYNYKDIPIVIDMKITPHLAIVGISNNGKTKGVEQMLYNLEGATIDILNSMDKDYIQFKDNKINGDDNIIDYLYHISHDEEVREIPHYIVIDEYNVLSHLKGFDDIITDLLRQARHRNIFIILIAQQLQLDYCPFRDLFNSRLCFKQLNKQFIFSFIGHSVENTNLKQREFILLHQKLEYGKTYKLL